MKLFFKKFIAINFILLLSLFSYAQATFTATIKPETACKNEFITLILTVQNGNDISEITPPNFDNFTVVSGPTQEQSINEVNGVKQQYVSLIYILKAKKTGNFILKNISAKVNGVLLYANQLRITINNKSSTLNTQNTNNYFSASDLFDASPTPKQFEDYILKKGEIIADKISKNMLLLLQTSKNICFVGEPVLATYTLCTRLPTQSTITKNPSFNGFSVIDMLQYNATGEGEQVSIKGRMYNTYVVRKAQLYPLQAGSIELETATVNNNVTLVQPNNNDASNTIPFTQNINLNSKPISIFVKPLPDKNVPSNFNGIVGNFSIATLLNNNTITISEVALLTITIKGEGNMQLITPPSINWPKGIEVFETKVIDNINQATMPISGSKIFEIPFSVTNGGSYTIPEISFSFFDPKIGKYFTTKSYNLPFTVIKKDNSILPIIDNNKAGKTNTIAQAPALKKQLFFALLFLTLLAGIAYFLYTKKHKKFTNSATDKFKIIPIELDNNLVKNKNYLMNSNNCLLYKNGIGFYTILLNEFTQFLSEVLKMPIDKINAKNLVVEMDKIGISNQISLQVQQLLQQLNLKLYTPTEQNKLYENYFTETQELIEKIKLCVTLS